MVFASFMFSIILAIVGLPSCNAFLPSMNHAPPKHNAHRSTQRHRHLFPFLFMSATSTSPIQIDRENGTLFELDNTQEEALNTLLNEALFRMSFFMETDYLLRIQNDALRSLFQICVDAVQIQPSTIPQAGRGLFATRDIPPGTIVAFYPVDCIGLKFQSGHCISVQLAKRQEDVIDVEQSSYALFSLLQRDLCGVDLQNEFQDDELRLFVDMNPNKISDGQIPCGWYCGLINDAATVQSHGALEYYPTSRSKQNVEIIPFSTAPFQVGVTTKNVLKGEELFVSYGYSYWNNMNTTNTGSENNQKQNNWKPKPLAVEEQEKEAMAELYATIDATEETYKEASWVLSYVFNHMNSEEPPPLTPPQFMLGQDHIDTDTNTSTNSTPEQSWGRSEFFIPSIIQSMKQLFR